VEGFGDGLAEGVWPFTSRRPFTAAYTVIPAHFSAVEHRHLDKACVPHQAQRRHNSVPATELGALVPCELPAHALLDVGTSTLLLSQHAPTGGMETRPLGASGSPRASPRAVPSVGGATSRSLPGGPAPARRAMRIFYPLEEECPAQYYPQLHTVNARRMRLVRAALLVMCLLQLAASCYIYKHSHMHDYVYEFFTVGANALSAFAAVSGFVGVAIESRGALLFYYINQLWSLSNVCTFFVMTMGAYEQQVPFFRFLGGIHNTHSRYTNRKFHRLPEHRQAGRILEDASKEKNLVAADIERSSRFYYSPPCVPSSLGPFEQQVVASFSVRLTRVSSRPIAFSESFRFMDESKIHRW